MPGIEELLARRSDLSTFVVHLTRAAQVSAAVNLGNILRSGTIEARTALGWAKEQVQQLGGPHEGSQRVVSFSETPLEHVYALFAPIGGRRIELEPYGVAFTKIVARRKGANPVWYVDMTPGRTWEVARALDALRGEAEKSGNFSSHPASKLFPFIEGMGTWGASKKEFWWEREWRHVGPFFFRIDEVALVLAPEDEHKDFDSLAPGRVIDPSWSLERMVAKLVGLGSADVSPFTG